MKKKGREFLENQDRIELDGTDSWEECSIQRRDEGKKKEVAL